MTRDEQAMQFLDSYKKLEKDPDKSKILSVNALLGYDDGGGTQSGTTRGL